MGPAGGGGLGAFALDADHRAAVRFAHEIGRAVADRIAPDRIFDEVVAAVRLRVVHRQRPERLGRNAAGRHSPAIGVLARQTCAVRIEVGMKVHRFLFPERRDPTQRHKRPKTVVAAEIADAAGLVAPPVDDQITEQEAFAQVLDPDRQETRPFCEQGRGGLLFSADAPGGELPGAREFPLASRRTADQLVDDSKEIGGIVRLRLGRDRKATRRLAARRGRYGDLLLHGLCGGKIARPVDQNARQHPDIVRARPEQLHAVGSGTLPFRSRDPEAAAVPVGRARAHIGEVVGKRVHEGDGQIAITHGGRCQFHRTTRQVEQAGRIDRVVVGRGHVAGTPVGQLRTPDNGVERAGRADASGQRLFVSRELIQREGIIERGANAGIGIVGRKQACR